MEEEGKGRESDDFGGSCEVTLGKRGEGGRRVWSVLLRSRGISSES